MGEAEPQKASSRSSRPDSSLTICHPEQSNCPRVLCKSETERYGNLTQGNTRQRGGLGLARGVHSGNVSSAYSSRERSRTKCAVNTWLEPAQVRLPKPQIHRAHEPAEFQDELFWTKKLGAVQFLLCELSEAIKPWH